jgi:hypothetical protein
VFEADLSDVSFLVYRSHAVLPVDDGHVSVGVGNAVESENVRVMAVRNDDCCLLFIAGVY